MQYRPMATRPRAQWEGDEKPATVETTMTVYEQDAAPEHTGLLNQHGVPIYRMPDKRKIGYLW